MPHRPRVLLIAEAANPEWVSVPLEGWSNAQALRGVADVHLVTQIRNREAILRAGLVEGTDFTVIDSEIVARPLWALAKVLRMGEGRGWTMITAISALAYPWFEHLVWRRFGDDIRAGRFDLVHRVTPLTPTISSPIAPKCRRYGVPFILGPLNGGVPWPPGFGAERRREREWLSYLRSAYKLLPGRYRTLEAASAIIAGSHHTESEIPERFRAKCIYVPENGIDRTRFPFTTPEQGTEGARLRACFIGRLVPYKGPDMLIESAAPLLHDGRLQLDIIGDGPMMADLRAQVERDSLSHAVQFHGWLPHEQVQEVARRSTVFAFPSIREFGGAVVLEAMALGIVPVVVDYGGPAELVTATTGFKVPLGRRAEIIEGFRERLCHLANAPDCLPAMGRAGRTRVERLFTWERKADQIREIYGWVLGERGEAPQFDMDAP